MADACVNLLELPDDKDKGLINNLKPCLVNIGTGKDITISELAEMVKEIVGFDGKIVFDTSKPDGTPQKLLDVSRMDKLGWKAKITLRQGIGDTYQWFIENVRG
jgi:GDP-L-fucose synthase